MVLCFGPLINQLDLKTEVVVFTNNAITNELVLICVRLRDPEMYCITGLVSSKTLIFSSFLSDSLLKILS